MHRPGGAKRHWIAMTFLLLVGCSVRSDRPATAPVEGTVTYRGQPVAGANIAFLCPGAPRMAIGTSDAVGHYRLTTFEPDDGAVIGTHVMTVKKYATSGGASGESIAEPIDPKEMAKAIEKSMNETALHMQKAEQTESLLPRRYADLRTSPLKREVVAEQNVINIELTD